MFRTLPLATTTTTLAFGAAAPPASEARQRAGRQARADGDDLGASKGILLAALVCVPVWLLLAAIVL